MTLRQSQVDEMSSLALAKANVALHGGPGLGKTYMVGRLREGLGLHTSMPIVLSLDLSTVRRGNEAFGELYEELRRRQNVGTYQGLGADTRTGWKALREEVIRCPRLVVLVLDEMDAVLRWEDGAEFIRLLREILHKSKEYGCVGVLASRRPLAHIEEALRGISTLAGVCFAVYMKSVQVDELAQLWPDLVECDPASRQRVVAYSGGLPPLINVYLALECVVGGPMPSQSDRLNDHVVAIVDRQLDYVDALGLGGALAQEVLGPVINTTLRERRLLCSLGVISEYRDGEPHLSVLADMEHFKEALRHRALDLSPWGVFGEAEKATRSLIESIMTNSFGADWTKVAATNNTNVDRLIAQAESERLTDHKKHGRDISWLAYTYPKDLWAIMSAHWPSFAPVFTRGDKGYWRERFMGLGTLRNPLAHNREEALTESQRVQLKVWSEEILRFVEAELEGHESA